MTNNDKVTLVSTLFACHSRFGDNSTVFALCLCAIIYTFIFNTAWYGRESCNDNNCKQYSKVSYRNYTKNL